ncbi:MAG: substrate-binding domain-containing protein [Pirellulaceae bacterium]
MRRACGLLLISSLVLAGCSSRSAAPARSITLATATSAQDSGLLDVLLPAFERESGIHVKVVAVGTGQALELGKRGDVDVLLTHSPADEQEYIQAGHGLRRIPVMHNDFVVVGPANDPAQVKRLATVADAFAAIAKSGQPFVSRGDESGTHRKELELWQAAAIRPQGDWYLQAGSGQAQTLRLAHEKRAYTLTDRGTYLAIQTELDGFILLEGDERLLNYYSVITLNKTRHPHLRDREADLLATFLTSQPGQDLIRTFGVEKYGRPLFVPGGDEPASDGGK